MSTERKVPATLEQITPTPGLALEVHRLETASEFKPQPDLLVHRRQPLPMSAMLHTYNDNSALQATCQTVGNPILSRMAACYADAAGDASLRFVRIAEFGCSGGRNSAAPMSATLSALLEGRPDLQVECVLEDLPSNPWQQVMNEIPNKMVGFDRNVHILCAGTSFYKQVCAGDSLDLAYSYNSIKFLSDSQPLASHVIMHESASGERSAWEAQAARDWETFLLMRACELKKGAKMMICTMGRDDSGYSWRQFSQVLWASIRRASDQGILTRQEAESLFMPACIRSEAEIMAPFAMESPAGRLFHVDSLQFARTEVEGERDLPISVLAPLMRRRVEAVWGGMFLTQLARLGRVRAAATDALTQVWNMFQEALATNPSLGWLEMRSFYLELTRV